MKIRSHANYQRELNARSRAWTIGLITVLVAVAGVCCGVCAVWNTLGGTA
jgi:hypothetical protein